MAHVLYLYQAKHKLKKYIFSRMMSPVKATLFVGSPFSWVDLNETNKFEKFYVKVALCEERHFFLVFSHL